MFKSNKYNKPLPKQVICKLNDHRGHSFQEVIDIPNGWRFILGETWHRSKLVDESGNVHRVFDWQAGYSEEYEFIY